MATVKEALLKLEAHERECAVRMVNIEKRLDDGSERFKKSEMMLWGMYPLIIGLFFIERLA
tara:strand:+ start:772 stop:954 length:183 start_codon:yes stop_codon:yes gene_type:complete